MKSICIYCGSNPGAKDDYSIAAKKVGITLAKADIKMIYGGGNIGLMGITADAALESGGEVIGVIPEDLVKKEVAHSQLTELRIVQSMHERKLLMSKLADGFIALPGGIGTSEEILEAFTWMQLGIQIKPCGLLNLNGFYDGLITQLSRMVEDRFLRQEQLDQLIVESDVNNLIDRMLNMTPVVVDKWIDREKIVI